MNGHRWIWAASWASIWFPFWAGATTYEVAQRDPEANDNGPGTPQRPWKTLTKAAQTAAAGDVVVIRDGIYREHVIIKNNGTPEAWIRFEAGVGAHVVLTGADRLSDWKKAE